MHTRMNVVNNYDSELIEGVLFIQVGMWLTIHVLNCFVIFFRIEFEAGFADTNYLKIAYVELFCFEYGLVSNYA